MRAEDKLKIPSWSGERKREGPSEACLPQAGKGSQGTKLGVGGAVLVPACPA